VPQPSIKGSAFAGVVSDLNRLVSEGALSEAELAARLEPADRELLTEEIAPGFWYPMAAYDRMLALLVDKEGDPDAHAYLRGRGERAMKRMMELGVYSQLETLDKGWTRLVGRVMATFASVVYSFARWELRAESTEEGAVGAVGDEFTLVGHDDGLLSVQARATIEGAAAMLATRIAGGPVDVTSERVAPDRIELRGIRRAS